MLAMTAARVTTCGFSSSSGPLGGQAWLTSVSSLSMELRSSRGWQFCSSPNCGWKLLLGVLKYLAMRLIVWFSPSNAFHCFSCQKRRTHVIYFITHPEIHSLALSHEHPGMALSQTHMCTASLSSKGTWLWGARSQ